MDVIFNSPERHELIEISKVISKYHKSKLYPPTHIELKFKDALFNYRQLLEEKKVPRLVAIYPFDPEDKKTWKYIDIVMTSTGGYSGDVLNPKWVYRRVANG